MKLKKFFMKLINMKKYDEKELDKEFKEINDLLL